MESLLAGSGFRTRQLRGDEGPPAVWGELRGKSDWTLLFYNHYAHAPNEHIRLEDIAPAVRFLEALLTELGS